MLRAVFQRFTLSPAGAGPEATRRRSITFSPSRSATVLLHVRTPVDTSAEPTLVAST